MKITRRFTEAGKSPYDSIEFRRATSEIKNPDGSIVFRLDGFDVPEHWSQVAADILAQKYFRKAGVARRLKKRRGDAVPSLAVALRRPTRARSPSCPRTSASAARRMRARSSTAWPAPGPTGAGRAATSTREEDARAFYDEHRFMLATQMARAQLAAMVQHRPALGLRHRRPGPGSLLRRPSRPASSRPSDIRLRAARSRTPASSSASRTTWSTRAASWTCGCARRASSSTARAPAPTSPALRGDGEQLSGGGKSSGLMSFLKIGDRAAGAIKSGGTTRRAAKMVMVDVDHPDIEEFIDWKVREEQKVAALVAGSKLCQPAPQRDHAGLRQLRRPTARPLRSRRKNPALAARDRRRAPAPRCPRTTSSASSSSRARATREIEFPTYDTDWESRSLPHRLRPELQQLRARHRRLPERVAERSRTGQLTARTTASVQDASARAICGTRSADAAWASADPGVQFDTTINDWHTCPESGRINASNPCSEYMFLDDTACNLASLNLMRVPHGTDGTRSTSSASSMPAGCGRSCSRSR